MRDNLGYLLFLICSQEFLIFGVIFKFNKQPQAQFVDPLITVFFSIIVIFTTVKIMKKTIRIIMEAVPPHISYAAMKNDLERVEGVL